MTIPQIVDFLTEFGLFSSLFVGNFLGYLVLFELISMLQVKTNISFAEEFGPQFMDHRKCYWELHV